jgi:cytochrome b
VSKTEASQRIRVWDPLVRVSHWLLVLCVAVAWFNRHHLGPRHENWGYGALAVIGLRLVWGFAAGNRYARFAQFVRSGPVTWAYLRGVLQGTAPRHIGHNPLGGWMVLALMSCIGLLGFTGWLYNTDMFWGYGWLADLHAGLGWTLLGLIALHLTGVVLTSIKHRENLVRAMLTGHKAPAGPADVD